MRSEGGGSKWSTPISHRNKTIQELHELIKNGAGIDLLKDFSEAAREELRAFTSRFASNSAGVIAPTPIPPNESCNGLGPS